MLQSSNSLLILWSDMREATGSFEFVEILTSRPEVESIEEKKVRHDLEAMWFALVHVKIYGKKECEKWCVEHKGKRLHQKVTNSTRAYVKLLLEDRAPVYKEEYDLRASLKGKDVELYKQYKRNNNCVTPEDKKR